MTAQVIAFPRRADIVRALREAESEILLVILAEEDEEAQADLRSVISKLQEIILQISGPLSIELPTKLKIKNPGQRRDFLCSLSGLD
jgi:hypothetical protein